MKRLMTLLAAVALAALTTAPVAAQPPEQDTDLLAFADFSDAGEARLLRTDKGVVTHVKGNGIPAGVYTLWWVVWNTPEGCATPFACTEIDLFDPEGDTGLAIGYGGGAIVGRNGKLAISSHLKEGVTLRGFPYDEHEAIGLSLPETSLVDSKHAEIHLVLRTHGELIPGMVATQRGTFNGGCVYNPPITGAEPAYGTPGPNTCADQFFAVFPSINTP